MEIEVDITYEIPEFKFPSELELIKIFPECKEIIPQKIREWINVKDKIMAEDILPILKKINAIKDRFKRWFWTEVLKCMLPWRYVEAITNLERLYRLKLLTSNAKYHHKAKDFERRKILAKEIPLLSLYSFQRLRRTGRRYTALCPFHTEKTPSFVIYPDNSFHCFGCEANGDAIEFVKLLKDCSFSDAVAQMTRATGV
jgi:hypothetical protein